MAADRRWKPVLLFLLLLALFPAVGSVDTWLRGEAMAFWDWLGVLVFPLLAWLWFRYFSILGCRQSCLPPDRERK